MSNQRGRVCPHLGLARDATTHMGFPSLENRCFKGRPLLSPLPDHQQKYCLGGTYNACSIYQGAGTDPLPSALSGIEHILKRPSKVTLFVIVMLFILGLAFWGSRLREKEVQVNEISVLQGTAPGVPTPPALSAISIPVSQASPQSVPVTITDTSIPLITVAVTSTSLPTDTATPMPDPYGFEVTRIPSGSELAYLVHIVASGETLDMIAVKYDTSIQAIMAVNYKLKPPVWAEYPIVIPVGVEDAAGLPAFEVYVVDLEVIQVEALAGLLDVDPRALELYNLCANNCQFEKGDVLLIPRSQ